MQSFLEFSKIYKNFKKRIVQKQCALKQAKKSKLNLLIATKLCCEINLYF